MARRRTGVAKETAGAAAAGERTVAPRRPNPPASGLRVGLRLRHTRVLRSLTLGELARASGCSESLLSKIENGKSSPSLGTLERIAAALAVPIADLLQPHGAADAVVLRHGERPMIGHFRTGRGIKLEAVIPAGAGYLLAGFIQHIEAGGGSGEAVSHEGEEFGYIIAGGLELIVANQVYQLGPGDSFVFRSDVPHTYRNVGEQTAAVIWLNTPPTF